jgi:hypothetical protein
VDARRHEKKEFLMKGAAWIIQWSTILCLSAGCGDPQPTPAGNAASNSVKPEYAANSLPAAAAATEDAAASQPDQVVAQFYEALREGDNAAIERLLTDRAREETTKSGLAIQSQTSGSLSYTVGETDYVTDNMDGAHVMSLWTEPDGQGSSISTDVIWVLRKQHNGWKISGMATPVEEGQLPLLFNFENPEDMMQKKAYVESQVADAGDQLDEPGTAAQPTGALPGTTSSINDADRPDVAELDGTSPASLR